MELVQKLMVDFARETGLVGDAPPRRYLWTDAFAVCNFIGLFRELGDREFLDLAKRLIDQVHFVLGRHRVDDRRRGWISGLSEDEGFQHPTRGGLRIGKKLNERELSQPPDDRLEWERDGQYFHYLTKWIQALIRFGRVSGNHLYRSWAAELADVAYRSFVYSLAPGGPKRMYWKMSIDLGRPLVDAMGQHDPLDGLISFLELQSEARRSETNGPNPVAITDFRRICSSSRWATHDPLSIGGLLMDGVRLSRMINDPSSFEWKLLRDIVSDTVLSLKTYAGRTSFVGHAESRLAFRELGLAIGLRGVDWFAPSVRDSRELGPMIESLKPFREIGRQIESFWIRPLNRLTCVWLDHQDINTVMLATSLSPIGYFGTT